MKVLNYLKKKKALARTWMTSLMIACMPASTFAAEKKISGGFSGILTGIHGFCDAATPLIAGLLVAELIIIGIKAQINKAEGKAAVKTDVIWVLIGTGIGLCASALGEEVTSWFVVG